MKNKFAKKLLAFALTGAMLLALAACTKTPQEPETGGSDASTDGENGSTGGENGSGSGETPEEPDNSGIIVVPTEPTESGGSGTQTTDPVTGEPLPPEV